MLDEVVVRVHVFPAAAGGHRAEDEDRLHGVEAVPDGLQRPEQIRVDQHHPITGMVDRVGELLGREPVVPGVQHRAHARHCEVGLQVPAGVPGQAEHSVARADAEIAQHGDEPTHPVTELGVGEPLVAGRRPGDHLPVGEDPFGAPEQPRHQQLPVHHQPVHGVPPLTGRWFVTGKARRRDDRRTVRFRYTLGHSRPV